jgi:hypothetical protein
MPWIWKPEGVAVTVAGGAAGDTETILETLPQAGVHIAEVACATNNEEVRDGRIPKVLWKR